MGGRSAAGVGGVFDEAGGDARVAHHRDVGGTWHVGDLAGTRALVEEALQGGRDGLVGLGHQCPGRDGVPGGGGGDVGEAGCAEGALRGVHEASGGGGQVGGEHGAEGAGFQVEVSTGGAVGPGVGHRPGRRLDDAAWVLVDQYAELFALVGYEGGDVHERLDVGNASCGVGDHGAAVGVADQHDRAADRGKDAGEVGGVAGL